MVFRTRHDRPDADTDAGGGVHHAAGLRFAEAARAEYLRRSGLPHARMLTEHHRAFVVRRARIAYVALAPGDAALVWETAVDATRGASGTLRQTVTRDGATIATMGSALGSPLGCVDARTLRAARIAAA